MGRKEENLKEINKIKNENENMISPRKLKQKLELAKLDMKTVKKQVFNEPENEKLKEIFTPSFYRYSDNQGQKQDGQEHKETQSTEDFQNDNQQQSYINYFTKANQSQKEDGQKQDDNKAQNLKEIFQFAKQRKNNPFLDSIIDIPLSPEQFIQQMNLDFMRMNNSYKDSEIKDPVGILQNSIQNFEKQGEKSIQNSKSEQNLNVKGEIQNKNINEKVLNDIDESYQQHESQNLFVENFVLNKKEQEFV
ncbi:hypothetical protein PPERSA_09392 [Pseudocohnilembus persalinus]|uniref:Uncharacterized protein n=1 Tax=Pseudocohnilembus persalinus TaxID=266149 RepID=A0A0V0QL54_PSEPJ|nr:hypothetical protein PPERSA_09392 [Pseudocohnilembus persalinus]|eukprot:KRX02974.1 hypothetical protein PPERSA_09392 [Pseudocohnilembus persalinus]